MTSDAAAHWLQDNDPAYCYRHKLEYPYLTGRQLDFRRRREIPVSCLDTRVAAEWTGLSDDTIKAVQELLN